MLRHEKEKKQEYNKRIINIEHGTFTSLVFSVSGVLGKESSMFHKHITEKQLKNLMKVMKKLSLLLDANYHLQF